MKTEMKRIVRKLMMLSVLAASLVAFSSGLAPTVAAPLGFCCSVNCDEWYYECIESCGDPASGACESFCEHGYIRCTTRECNPGC